MVRDEQGLLPLHLSVTQRLGVVESRTTAASPLEEREEVGLLDILALRPVRQW